MELARLWWISARWYILCVCVDVVELCGGRYRDILLRLKPSTYFVYACVDVHSLVVFAKLSWREAINLTVEDKPSGSICTCVAIITSVSVLHKNQCGVYLCAIVLACICVNVLIKNYYKSVALHLKAQFTYKGGAQAFFFVHALDIHASAHRMWDPPLSKVQHVLEQSLEV